MPSHPTVRARQEVCIGPPIGCTIVGHILVYGGPPTVPAWPFGNFRVASRLSPPFVHKVVCDRPLRRLRRGTMLFVMQHLVTGWPANRWVARHRPVNGLLGSTWWSSNKVWVAHHIPLGHPQPTLGVCLALNYVPTAHASEKHKIDPIHGLGGRGA